MRVGQVCHTPDRYATRARRWMIVLCGARGRLREEVICQHLIPSALYPMSSVLPIAMAIYARAQGMPVGQSLRRHSAWIAR